MNTRPLAILPLCLATLALTGCSDLSSVVPFVHINAEKICSRFADQTITGTGPVLDTSHLEASETVTTDLSDLFSAVDVIKVKSHFTVKSATMIGRRGVEDFGFLDEVKITLAPNAKTSSLPPLGIIDYRKGDEPGAVAMRTMEGEEGPLPTLSTQTASSANISPYLQEGAVDLTMTMRGRLPAEDWTIDVEVCMGGAITHAP